MTYWLIPFFLPSIVLGHVWGLLLLATGFARDPRWDRGIFQVTWRDWAADRWRYSTTIGHSMALQPDADNETIYHETVHVLQYEDLCLLGAVIAGILVALPNYGISWIEGLVLWGTSGAPWLLPNYFTGWVRFGDAYRGSEHERSAYAQTAQALREA